MVPAKFARRFVVLPANSAVTFMSKLLRFATRAIDPQLPKILFQDADYVFVSQPYHEDSEKWRTETLNQFAALKTEIWPVHVLDKVVFLLLVICIDSMQRVWWFLRKRKKRCIMEEY